MYMRSRFVDMILQQGSNPFQSRRRPKKQIPVALMDEVSPQPCTHAELFSSLGIFVLAVWVKLRVGKADTPAD